MDPTRRPDIDWLWSSRPTSCSCQLWGLMAPVPSPALGGSAGDTSPSGLMSRKSIPTIPIGTSFLRLAVFASVLAAASQAEAACVSGRCTDATAVEHVRALVSSAGERGGAKSDGRFFRCAKDIVRGALRGGSQTPRPIPPPVAVRQEPEGVMLEDPAFEALPGARADFGRLGGPCDQ